MIRLDERGNGQDLQTPPGFRELLLNPKIFSIKEANKMIASLEKLTSQLLLKKIEMQKMHDQILILDLLAGEKIHDPASADGQEYLKKTAELEALVLSFEDDILEINRNGCYLRDINKGSIDFFSVRKNELVYLNWQRGEPEIKYYHDVDAHHTQRRPLNEDPPSEDSDSDSDSTL